MMLPDLVYRRFCVLRSMGGMEQKDVSELAGSEDGKDRAWQRFFRDLARSEWVLEIDKRK